jgi:hypothetical protein
VKKNKAISRKYNQQGGGKKKQALATKVIRDFNFHKSPKIPEGK